MAIDDELEAAFHSTCIALAKGLRAAVEQGGGTARVRLTLDAVVIGEQAAVTWNVTGATPGEDKPCHN